MKAFLPCPKCSADIEFDVTSEMYGADADGNRGEEMWYAEPNPTCSCTLTDNQWRDLLDQAVEERINA